MLYLVPHYHIIILIIYSSITTCGHDIATPPSPSIRACVPLLVSEEQGRSNARRRRDCRTGVEL